MFWLLVNKFTVLIVENMKKDAVIFLTHLFIQFTITRVYPFATLDGKSSFLYVPLIRSSRKEVMLGYNKNYTILALNCTLKNSKGTLSALGINGRYRNNDMETN